MDYNVQEELRYLRIENQKLEILVLENKLRIEINSRAIFYIHLAGFMVLSAWFISLLIEAINRNTNIGVIILFCAMSSWLIYQMIDIIKNIILANKRIKDVNELRNKLCSSLISS